MLVVFAAVGLLLIGLVLFLATAFERMLDRVGSVADGVPVAPPMSTDLSSP